jgi:hypothetical protein
MHTPFLQQLPEDTLWDSHVVNLPEDLQQQHVSKWSRRNGLSLASRAQSLPILGPAEHGIVEGRLEPATITTYPLGLPTSPTRLDPRL